MTITLQKARKIASKAPQGYGREFESVPMQTIVRHAEEERMIEHAWDHCGLVDYHECYRNIKGAIRMYDDGAFVNEADRLPEFPACDWETRLGLPQLIKIMLYLEHRAFRNGICLLDD